MVPKRRFNTKTARGLINKRAYEMDVTRRQLAKAANISISLANNTLAPRSTKKLHAWMLKAWVAILAITPEEEILWASILDKERLKGLE